MQSEKRTNRLALCANEKCGRKDICMRFKLRGDQNDTWIEFQPVRMAGKILCRYFIHANSEDALIYKTNTYKGTPGGNYET